MSDILTKSLIDALQRETDSEQCGLIAERLAQVGSVGLPLIVQELRASSRIDTVTTLLQAISLMDGKLTLDSRDKDVIARFLDNDDLEIREAAVYAVAQVAPEVLAARLQKESNAFIRSLIVDAMNRCIV